MNMDNYVNLFTFEVNRHGARAPYWDNDAVTKGFTMGKEGSLLAGMLSQQGMRQRFFLGKYNKDKIYKNELIHPLDFYVESTDYYRTIQSAYAELSGMLED